MRNSSVVEFRRVRDVAVPDTAGWAGPAPRGPRAYVTEAVRGVRRNPFALGACSGGSAKPSHAPRRAHAPRPESAVPVLAFVDPQTASEPAGEMPRAAPARRRICTTMRLSAERYRRLGLVASFTGRSAQSVIVAALQAYLRDMISGSTTLRERAAGASSPSRDSRRSLRLHPHLYWRLAIAARKAGCSMQSILAVALDQHLDTVAPEISAEVFSCLMGWTDRAGVSAQ